MPRYVVPLLCCLLIACTPPAPPEEIAVADVRILDFDVPATDHLALVNEMHDYRFIGGQGDVIHVALRNQNANVVLSLMDANGAVIAGGNDIQLTLTEGGTYSALVRLTEGDPSNYTLLLEREGNSAPVIPPTATPAPAIPTEPPTDIPTPTPPYNDLGDFKGVISNGAATSGLFSGGLDEGHVYLFRGEAGSFATVRMARMNGSLDPAVMLRDPNGKPIALDDNSGGDGGALLQNIRLTGGGDYIIEASGADLPGEYRLLLTTGTERLAITPIIPNPTATITPNPSPAALPDRLVDHVPVMGRVARPGDFARYPIIAVQGEVFTVGVSPITGTDLRPSIELYNPSGVLVKSATATTSEALGDALIPAYRAEETGTYVALVQGEEDDTGEYVISYGVGASRENVLVGAARVDLENRGTLARRGLRAVWTITLTQGDLITASVRADTPSFDPALDLVAPDGAVVAFDDNSGGDRSPLINNVRAPVSGPYSLRVTGADALSFGAYALIWRYISTAPTATPPEASLLILSADDLMPPQTYRFYPFQGQATQRVQIRVRANAETNLDPVVALLGPDGTLLAEADDNGADLNPVLYFELPTDGTYTVRVNGYGETTGDFEVFVEVLF